MFKKLKTTTLAVVTAAATLHGVEHAHAFDLPTNGPPVVRGVGCTASNVQGAFMGYSRLSQGLAYVSRVGSFQYFPGSPSYDANRAYRYDAQAQAAWEDGVSTGCPLDEIVVERFERPENVDVPAEGDPGAAAAYAATQYIGVVFTARNTDDGLYYRHEWAVSGATNTQLINTRTLITPPDTTPPTVELSSSTSTLSGVTPFTVTATFNEYVTGFAEADVTVTNGGVVAGSLSGGAAVYTFLVEPTGNGDVTIIVRENVAQDLAGNPNTGGLYT